MFMWLREDEDSGGSSLLETLVVLLLVTVVMKRLHHQTSKERWISLLMISLKRFFFIHESKRFQFPAGVENLWGVSEPERNAAASLGQTLTSWVDQSKRWSGEGLNSINQWWSHDLKRWEAAMVSVNVWTALRTHSSNQSWWLIQKNNTKDMFLISLLLHRSLIWLH